MRVVSLVVLCLMLFHAASLTAAPLGEERADLVRYENVQTENGYRFSFETKDGQIREEVGTIDVPTGVLKVSGRYSYRTPDGASYRVDFVADENGYRTIEQPNVAVQMLPFPTPVGALNLITRLFGTIKFESTMNKKTISLLLVVFSLILSIDARPTNEVNNNYQHFEVIRDQYGGQSFSYKTDDGQWRNETVKVDANTGKLIISGWYRYVGTDGEIYQVKYVADENGFRPLGAHLPGADLSDRSIFDVSTRLANGLSRTSLLSLAG
ncbi:uncharacterized protein LOC131293940 [Anopheles ziemanni]|uniref:uncharacterized protein LOC131264698 n=1 Tax=Anopheles coustani TaxID=139045 RepID=UPI0026581C76|nr:uncharacterized protein LOC131264698 [Anopheles coustani]XP_058177972.1 uncharacterized protein LOC131293940 [Anopheles ziemanni]